jgi:hypothetical protein
MFYACDVRFYVTKNLKKTGGMQSSSWLMVAPWREEEKDPETCFGHAGDIHDSLATQTALR